MKFGTCILTVGIVLILLNINNIFINQENDITDYESNFKAYDIGPIVYSIKTPSGLFFENKYNEKEYFIGGTEVRTPSFASVYIIDMQNKNIIKEFKIKNANAVWSFCETKDNIFFGTIDGIGGNGATFYSIDKKDFNLTQIYTFKERMIYAMDYDGIDKIYIGTSEEPNLYSYDILLNKMDRVNKNAFTNKHIIRTLVYSNEKCYIGMGSKADFVIYDLKNNTYISALDKDNQEESFVYDIKDINGKIVYILSPSLKIMEYDENSKLSKEIIPKNRNNINFKLPMYNFAGKKLFYDEKKEEYYLLEQDDLLMLNINKGLMQGVTSSGVFKSINFEGEVIEIIDLSKKLEKTWEQPIEFIVDNDILYFPGRRFLVFNNNKKNINIGIMNSEPQASVISSKGIYTANYTDAKIWFYPFDFLLWI